MSRSSPGLALHVQDGEASGGITWSKFMQQNEPVAYAGQKTARIFFFFFFFKYYKPVED